MSIPANRKAVYDDLLKLRAEPFQEVEIDLANLWWRDQPAV